MDTKLLKNADVELMKDIYMFFQNCCMFRALIVRNLAFLVSTIASQSQQSSTYHRHYNKPIQSDISRMVNTIFWHGRTWTQKY